MHKETPTLLPVCKACSRGGVRVLQEKHIAMASPWICELAENRTERKKHNKTERQSTVSTAKSFFIQEAVPMPTLIQGHLSHKMVALCQDTIVPSGKSLLKHMQRLLQQWNALLRSFISTKLPAKSFLVDLQPRAEKHQLWAAITHCTTTHGASGPGRHPAQQRRTHSGSKNHECKGKILQYSAYEHLCPPFSVHCFLVLAWFSFHLHVNQANLLKSTWLHKCK